MNRKKITDALEWVIMGVKLCKDSDQVEIPVLVTLKEINEENINKLVENGMDVEDTLRVTKQAYGKIKLRSLKDILDLNIVIKVDVGKEIKPLY